MDLENDALENMLLLHWSDAQLKFLIKHNFRREDRYAIAEESKSVCRNVKHPREGKTVYISSTWRNFETKKGGQFAIRMVYEITEKPHPLTVRQYFSPKLKSICTGLLSVFPIKK